MNLPEEIKKQYPSICYNCTRSRQVVSQEYESKGYVGCTLLVEELLSITHILRNISCKEQYSGWVYLRREPFSMSSILESKIQSNHQLMTIQTEKCKYFNKR